MDDKCKFVLPPPLASVTSTNHLHRDGHNPKELVDRILSIAPILPGQKGAPEPEARRQPQTTTQEAPIVDEKPAVNTSTQGQLSAHDNLIDFDSRPPSVAPPEPVTKPDIAGNPIHPTSNPQQTPVHQSTTVNAPIGNPPKTANLMDDDHHLTGMNSQVSNMSLHQPLVPGGKTPLKRSDTETSEVDVFVDAEG